MPNILILCHGRLAGEIVETVKLILGEQDDCLQHLNLLPEQDMDQYDQEIRHRILQSKEKGGILILTDIMGGSPFMNATKAYADLKEEVDIEIVTGVNLPMMLETISRLPHSSLEEATSTAIGVGASGIKDFKACLIQADEGRR